MGVTAAIVSWNTRDLLLRCLRSLADDVDAGRVDAWVVDNGSTDGSAEAARAYAPWAHVLELDENLGFGRSVNLVAARSQSDWLLVANADMALEPGALAAMLAAGRDPRIGCVAPRLLLPDGSTQHSVYPFPTLPFITAFNLGLHRVSGRLADRLCLEGHWDPRRARPVPWAIGACLLTRTRAFREVGGFDERQWIYAEDLDLGWRLHERGWVTWYEPAARARHESGAATRAAFGEQRADRYMAATYSVLSRRRGRGRALLTGALNVAGAAARLAWMAPLAVAFTRWRGPATQSRRWLGTHLRALRILRIPRNADKFGG
jgi:GT2 family glycosyltransferase